MHHSPELKTLHGNHCNVKFVACMDSPLHSEFILSFGGTTNTRIHMAKKWNYVHANKSLNVCCHVSTASKVSLTCMTHGRTTELSHANSLKIVKFFEGFERLPKRLQCTAIFEDHSDQSRRVALWQAWHTAESYLRSCGGAYAAFFNLPHAKAL